MSVTAEEIAAPPPSAGEDFQYRALSTGAIFSVILGVVSLLIFFAARNSLLSAIMIAPLPMAGLLVGLRSLGEIRRTPEYLSGAALAQAGSLLAGVCLVGGLGFASFVYATEVPEGYVRTSFMQFAPDQAEQQNKVVVPDDVLALDGKKVFFKGYIRPDSVAFDSGVREFLLVRDNNECCYGDQAKVKYFDQVAVKMVEGKTADFSRALFRVGGVLHVLPANAARGPGHPVFRLEADYIR